MRKLILWCGVLSAQAVLGAGSEWEVYWDTVVGGTAVAMMTNGTFNSEYDLAGNATITYSYALVGDPGHYSLKDRCNARHYLSGADLDGNPVLVEMQWPNLDHHNGVTLSGSFSVVPGNYAIYADFQASHPYGGSDSATKTLATLSLSGPTDVVGEAWEGPEPEIEIPPYEEGSYYEQIYVQDPNHEGQLELWFVPEAEGEVPEFVKSYNPAAGETVTIDQTHPDHGQFFLQENEYDSTLNGGAGGFTGNWTVIDESRHFSKFDSQTPKQIIALHDNTLRMWDELSHRFIEANNHLANISGGSSGGGSEFDDSAIVAGVQDVDDNTDEIEGQLDQLDLNTDEIEGKLDQLVTNTAAPPEFDTTGLATSAKQDEQTAELENISDALTDSEAPEETGLLASLWAKMDSWFDSLYQEEDGEQTADDYYSAVENAVGTYVEEPVITVPDMPTSTTHPTFEAGEFTIDLDPSKIPYWSAAAAWCRNLITWILTLLLVYIFISEVKESTATVFNS